jgi:fibronectin type 3 domain-containing protein
MIGVFDSTWATNYYWNSNGATITVTAAQSAPAAPTQLTATAGNTQVALSWTASSGAASYNVYRGAAAGGEGTTAVATGITTVTHTDTGLANGTIYFYKVAAVNPGGTSPLSNEASAKPIPPCDVNGDGVVNVSDIQMTIDQALGMMSAANAMNHGGVTNVVEVQIVTNAVLGKTCSGT